MSPPTDLFQTRISHFSVHFRSVLTASIPSPISVKTPRNADSEISRTAASFCSGTVFSSSSSPGSGNNHEEPAGPSAKRDCEMRREGGRKRRTGREWWWMCRWFARAGARESGSRGSYVASVKGYGSKSTKRTKQPSSKLEAHQKYP